MFPNALTVLAVQEMNSEFITTVVVTGLVVVFSALILLVLFISIFGMGFKALSKTDKPKETKPQAPTIQQLTELKPVTENGIEDEIIAVIAAAISAISSETGKKLAIRSIKRADRSVNAWAGAGVLENTRPF